MAGYPPNLAQSLWRGAREKSGILAGKSQTTLQERAAEQLDTNLLYRFIHSFTPLCIIYIYIYVYYICNPPKTYLQDLQVVVKALLLSFLLMFKIWSCERTGS